MSSDGRVGRIGKTCYTAAMVETANMSIVLLEYTETVRAKRESPVKDLRLEGSKVSMVKACPGSVAAISSTYGRDTFETLDSTTRSGVTRVIRAKGRRLGDCK